MAAPPFNLDWVTERLAVGGSFEASACPALAAELRLGAVIDMRAERCDDVAALARHGVDHLHLPTEDHGAVTLPMLRDGVAFARRHLEAGASVLIHCEHGIGRAPTMALCVLVDAGHAPLAALRLLKRRRPIVSPSVAQYHAWADWLALQRSAGRDVEVPHFDRFAAVAYRNMAAA